MSIQINCSTFILLKIIPHIPSLKEPEVLTGVTGFGLTVGLRASEWGNAAKHYELW